MNRDCRNSYDRDLNDVDGIDIFSECGLDAPCRVPAMLANDEQGNADADSRNASQNE